MSSILSSQGLVIATAMVVSSTALFLAFSNHHHKMINEKKKQKKKKKVRFAEDVKEPKGNGEEYRREHDEKIGLMEETRRGRRISCRNDIPANRIALYNGILKDRSQRIQCSF
ncbi:hypothetical protein E5676_scaffold655G001740 [Cucumis melo var. makuwa]|uniref:Transmembrane protein n=1 Tax=Cucumis melo var. makuwa TaxID=1194695 RepID=A0A5D3E1D5_CUCMM|nr:hypothetical protein E6C27_scaffold46G001730 [Cucumis melo var. makuwa]TYK29568.1 hypothetical protein E5676_scaffold655G001740 [Cucumis melo var. makuwa]